MFSVIVKNTMIIGAGFINKNSQTFCVVGYDSNEVHYFTLSKDNEAICDNDN